MEKMGDSSLPHKTEGIEKGVRGREGKPEQEQLAAERASFLFPSLENQGRFRKLAEKTRDFAVKLYESSGAGALAERVKINSVDTLKVTHNKALFDWHHGKAEKLSLKLEARNEEIKSREEQLLALDERLRSIREQFGEPSAAVKAGAERERKYLKSLLEKAGNKKGRLQSRLEHRNNKKGIYENKIKDIVGDVVNRIEGRLDPYERRLEKLQGRKEQLDTEEKNFALMRNGFQGRLADLESKSEAAEFKFERKQYSRLIKEVKAELKKINKDYLPVCQKERVEIEGKIDRVDKKANVWRDKRNEFSKFSQMDTVYHEVGERETVLPDLQRREVAGSRRRPEEFLKRSTEETPGGPQIPPERGTYEIREKEFSPGFFIGQWNALFGSELQVKFEPFTAILQEISKKTLAEKVQMTILESALRNYYTRRKEEGFIPWYFSSNTFEKRLKSFRFYLNSF